MEDFFSVGKMSHLFVFISLLNCSMLNKTNGLHMILNTNLLMTLLEDERFRMTTHPENHVCYDYVSNAFLKP